MAWTLAKGPEMGILPLQADLSSILTSCGQTSHIDDRSSDAKDELERNPRYRGIFTHQTPCIESFQ